MEKDNLSTNIIIREATENDAENLLNCSFNFSRLDSVSVD